MKICVTARGNTLDSPVDLRFGRCDYFIVLETDDMSFEAIGNQQAQAGGGAGVQSAQLMAAKEVSTILTGNVGPNAFQTLSAADISVVTGASGTVRETVEAWQKGLLEASDKPTVDSHAGMRKGSQ